MENLTPKITISDILSHELVQLIKPNATEADLPEVLNAICYSVNGECFTLTRDADLQEMFSEFLDIVRR